MTEQQGADLIALVQQLVTLGGDVLNVLRWLFLGQCIAAFCGVAVVVARR